MIFTYKNLGTHGALGNQMWEIASTAGIAMKCGANFLFPKWEYQPYFNIPSGFFSDSLPLECDLSGNYLQDLAYFSDRSRIVKKFFDPSKLSEKEIRSQFKGIDFSEYVAVHVRRGNNLGIQEFHPVQPISYYEEALDLIGGAKLIVFSDDLDWCRQQEIFENAIFGFGVPREIDVYSLTGEKPLALDTAAFDLLTMAKCRYHVISNSTFSWWAAYLAKSDMVVYPKNWYGPMVEADYSLMVKGLGWNGI